MYSWFLAARPKTLSAAIGPILVSWAYLQGPAFLFGSLSRPYDSNVTWLFVFALLSTICIQIGTNLVNDAADFERGADSPSRLGPQRVTQSGLLTVRQVYFGAMVFFLFAVGFGIPLVIEGGWPIVIIGLVSILSGYAYTTGPLPLAYKGLGEIFVLVFFGFLAVGGCFLIFSHMYSFAAFWLGLQIGLLSVALIAINNLRDRETDVLVQKKTLAVRLGPTLARVEILVCLLFPFFMNLYWIYEKRWMPVLLPQLLMPFATRLAGSVYTTNPGVEFNRFLGQAAALQLGFSALLAIGFMLGV